MLTIPLSVDQAGGGDADSPLTPTRMGGDSAQGRAWQAARLAPCITEPRTPPLNDFGLMISLIEPAIRKITGPTPNGAATGAAIG